MNGRSNIMLLLFCMFFYSSLVRGKNEVKIGAYFFDGWSGHRMENAQWTDNAPTHLTYLLKTTFASRMPLWGWRDDSLKIMEKQIKLASGNGLDFFSFCWYWSNDQKSINENEIINNPLNTSIRLFMRAKNKSKMKFCLMIANHNGYRINGVQNWKDAIKFMCRNYFKNSSYLLFDNKPVIVVFEPGALEQDANTIQEINQIAQEYGFSGIYLISCGYRLSGCDALTWYNVYPTLSTSLTTPYKDLVDYTIKKWYSQSKGENVIPYVMTGWDPRPWSLHLDSTRYCIQRSPNLFRYNLEQAVTFLKERNYQPKLIFIYAWNELGEGGWLVPTKGDPNADYLKQIKYVKQSMK